MTPTRTQTAAATTTHNSRTSQVRRRAVRPRSSRSDKVTAGLADADGRGHSRVRSDSRDLTLYRREGASSSKRTIPKGVNAAMAESVVGAFEGENVGVVDDPVDHRGGDGSVAEAVAQVAPVGTRWWADPTRSRGLRRTPSQRHPRGTPAAAAGNGLAPSFVLVGRRDAHLGVGDHGVLHNFISREKGSSMAIDCTCEGAGLRETVRADIDRYIFAIDHDGLSRGFSLPRLILSPRMGHDQLPDRAHGAHPYPAAPAESVGRRSGPVRGALPS